MRSKETPWTNHFQVQAFPGMSGVLGKSSKIHQKPRKNRKINLSRPSEGVRRRAWAFLNATFHGKSISEVYLTIRNHLGHAILKKHDFFRGKNTKKGPKIGSVEITLQKVDSKFFITFRDKCLYQANEAGVAAPRKNH